MNYQERAVLLARYRAGCPEGKKLNPLVELVVRSAPAHYVEELVRRVPPAVAAMPAEDVKAIADGLATLDDAVKSDP